MARNEEESRPAGAGTNEPPQTAPIYLPAGFCAPPEDEIDLLDLGLTLARGWRTILLVTVVLTGLAAIYMLRKPDRYTASARLMVNEVPDAQGNLTRPSPEEFTAYFQASGTLEKAFQAIGVLRANGDAYPLEEMRRIVSVSAGTDGIYLSISAEIPSATQARELVEGIVEFGFLGAEKSLLNKDIERQEKAEANLEQAQADLQKKKEAYAQLSKSLQVDHKDGEARVLGLERDRLQKEVILKTQLVAELTAKVEAGRADLEHLPPVLRLERTLAQSPELLEKLSERLKVPPAEILDTHLVVEEQNQAYVELQAMVGEARLELGAAKRMREATAEALEETKRRLDALRGFLIENRSKVESARFEMDLALQEVKDAQESLFRAKNRVWKRSRPLVVVEEARTPQQPSGPRRLLPVVGAAVAGLFLACFYVLVREAYRKRLARSASA